MSKMDITDFINEVGAYVQKYAPKFDIAVCSPIIAQAILESNHGTSNKVVLKDSSGKVLEWRHNYFGLKWRNGRCAVSNDYFEEWTKEQKEDGTYIDIVSRFCRFNSLEECVLGYFQWTNIANYSNLKGVTDPETYLRLIKQDKYATSKDYVKNVMDVIKKYNLTRFDEDVVKLKKILLISGHGAGDSGAVANINGITYKEADETVKLVELINERLMNFASVDVYPVERNAYQDLKNGSVTCSFTSYDYVLEIHFNACVKDYEGNGRSTGTEIYVCKSNPSMDVERSIVDSLSDVAGFTNRGVKKANYAVITKAFNLGAQSALLETCFIDDADDMKLYVADRGKVADAIVKGLVSGLRLQKIDSSTEQKQEQNEPKSEDSIAGTQSNCPFIVRCKTDLNIRKSPNGFVAQKGGAHKGICYTIVQVIGSWGKLKSGVGWISISSKYVERV